MNHDAIYVRWDGPGQSLIARVAATKIGAEKTVRSDRDKDDGSSGRKAAGGNIIEIKDGIQRKMRIAK